MGRRVREEWETRSSTLGGQGHASVWSRELGTRCSCMVDMHWTRVTRCDISSNTWRVTVWPTWEADLGHFQADFDHGPKMKFVVLVLLYIFRQMSWPLVF